jgi:FAD/FMN-containing dehydrogenase
MTAVRSVTAEVAEFGNNFRGSLMRADDEGYDEARRVHNGLINKKPALIAQCRDLSDVAGAVRLAQRLGLEVAVRGGGHNVAGRATSTAV